MDPMFLPKPYRSCPKDDGDSKLHQACYNGAYESVLMLILSGEDGHLDVMMLLLDSGASVNTLDHQNLTPLHQAVIHSNKHAAELLLCYGASVHNHSSVKDGSRSVLELASHVHVCHKVIEKADGHVWSLQHLCRIATRQSLGAARRKRIKELPIPKHLISYLCCLPVAKSDLLHQNWERVRSNKCEAIRKKGASRRLHQRLGVESLSISPGHGLSAVRSTERTGDARLAQGFHQEPDDADGNKPASNSSKNNDTIDHQSNVDIACTDKDDRVTLEEKSEEGFVRPNGQEFKESAPDTMSDFEARVATPNDTNNEDNGTGSNGTQTAVLTVEDIHTSQDHHDPFLVENEHEQELYNVTDSCETNQDHENYEVT